MSDQERVYVAICGGHRTASAIARHTGIAYGTVQTSLAALRTSGRIEHTPGHGNGFYRPTQRCLLAEAWK